MSSVAQVEQRTRLLSHRAWAGLRHLALRGAAIIYLLALVALPTIAVISKGFGDGFAEFTKAMDTPGAWAAIRLTLVMAAIVAATNAVLGRARAWGLARSERPRRR